MRVANHSREPLRWSMNEGLHAWLLTLAERLDLNVSVLVRMFALQLKEGDPATFALVSDFIELGLLDALVAPKTVKVFLEDDLCGWLNAYVRDLRHPTYPKRKIQVRHLLNGYAQYLRRNEQKCVLYGSIRLQASHQKESL